MTYLETLAGGAGEALQQIQDVIGDRTHVPEAVVRFPRGYVRQTRTIYAGLPDIGDHTRRRNLAYQLMRTDVCLWLLSRTDIYGQVRSVVIGEYINILAYGSEFLIKSLNRGRVTWKRPFAHHTRRLVDVGVIGRNLKREIDWLWRVRTQEHLDATEDLRHCTHADADIKRANNAWNALLNDLHSHIP